MLSSVPLPRLDLDSATFLQFDECKLLMDNGSTLKDELSDLQKVRSDYADNDDEHAERKKRDTAKNKSIRWSKVRMVQKCDECKAP